MSEVIERAIEDKGPCEAAIRELQARVEELERERDEANEKYWKAMDESPDVELVLTERRLERCQEALRGLMEAVKYAREPHHLNHEEECSLCLVAAEQIDAAYEKARSTESNQPGSEGKRG